MRIQGDDEAKSGTGFRPTSIAPEPVPDQRQLKIRKKRRLKGAILSDAEEISTANSSFTSITEPLGNPASISTSVSENQTEEEETLDPPEEQSTREEAKLQEIIEQRG